MNSPTIYLTRNDLALLGADAEFRRRFALMADGVRGSTFHAPLIHGAPLAAGAKVCLCDGSILVCPSWLEEDLNGGSQSLPVPEI